VRYIQCLPGMADFDDERGRENGHIESVCLIRRMSKKDSTWRIPRLASELALLGHDIAEATMAKRTADPTASHSKPPNGWSVERSPSKILALPLEIRMAVT